MTRNDAGRLDAQHELNPAESGPQTGAALYAAGRSVVYACTLRIR